MFQFSFVIIKPDAIERCIVGKLITRIERAYLHIDGMQMRRKSRRWCELHYAHLVKEEFFDKLVAFMTARSILGFATTGPFAIDRMRKLIGPADSRKAPPGTIRGDYGHYPVMYNCIHASSTVDDALREAKLFYDLTTDLQETEDASPILPEGKEAGV